MRLGVLRLTEGAACMDWRLRVEKEGIPVLTVVSVLDVRCRRNKRTKRTKSILMGDGEGEGRKSGEWIRIEVGSG